MSHYGTTCAIHSALPPSISPTRSGCCPQSPGLCGLHLGHEFRRNTLFQSLAPLSLQLREDLGGIEYTPTFIFVFFSENGIQRAKYEGTAEIQRGLQTGTMKGVIRELQRRRYACYSVIQMYQGPSSGGG